MATQTKSANSVSLSHTNQVQHLVFIDSNVSDYAYLAAGVIPGAEVIILEPNQDGIKQITQALNFYSYPVSLHIVSHGSPGCLYLGNSELSLDTLAEYTEELRSWFGDARSQEFRSSGVQNLELETTPYSLIIYGCSVAAGDAGEELSAKLKKLTGAEIAASTSPTGNAVLGGNWNLEVNTRACFKTITIATDLPFSYEVLKDWKGLLVDPDINWSTNNPVSVTNDHFETTAYSTPEDLQNGQSYQQDLYENWDPLVGGSGDTDIVSFSTSFDNDFVYFQWDLRENWNYASNGESRFYEIDIDADFEQGSGDSKSDFLLLYSPQTSHIGNTWLPEGGSKVTIFEDQNNDLGGNLPSAPDGIDNSLDGLEADVSLNADDVYVRIIPGPNNPDGKETGLFIEVAIRKSVLGNPTNIRARGWATQTSGLDKGKHFWHDENNSTDLPSNRQDNTAGANTADWTIVGPAATANNLPTAVADTNNATEAGTAVTGNVITENDTVGDAPANVTTASESGTNNPITIASPFTTANNGSLTLNSDGSYSYTPPPQGSVPPGELTETFNYTITDANGDTSSTTLTITVADNNLTTTASLGDKVFLDSNGDGIQDSGESGVRELDRKKHPITG